jgi:hypothetical protein
MKARPFEWEPSFCPYRPDVALASIWYRLYRIGASTAAAFLREGGNAGAAAEKGAGVDNARALPLQWLFPGRNLQAMPSEIRARGNALEQKT